MILFRKLSPDAKIPTRGSKYAAGLDLYLPKEVVVNRFGPTKLEHDIAWFPNEWLQGNIRPRSSSGLKRGLHVVYGTLDADFRGNISTVVYDIRPWWQKLKPIRLLKGERVSQLVPQAMWLLGEYTLGEASDFSAQAEYSERGANGFGSTGK